MNDLTSGVTVVASGGQHSLAVQNGALYTWGANNFFELGYGGFSNATTPGFVPGFTSGVTAMAGGLSHTLVVQNGGLFAWGTSASGELGGNFGSVPQLPVAVPTLTSGVTAVAAGNSLSLVIQNGAAISFGSNDVGQLGLGTTNNVANPTPTVIPGLTSGVTKIDTKFRFAAAIQNGALFTWGDNNRGQLGNGTNTNSSSPVAVTGMTSSVTDVSVGITHTLAVQNGVAYAWGSNDGGLLGTGQFEPSSNIPVVVPGLPNNIIEVETAFFSSYALTADHRLFVWGSNSLGELGDGTFNTSYTPEEIFAPSGSSFITLEGGGNHVMAIMAAVPEPSSILMLGSVAVAGGMGALRYRRMKRKEQANSW